MLLHDSLARDGAGSLLFSELVDLLVCRAPGEIASTFAAAERALDDGLHLAGAIAYELGYHLEPRLAPLAPAAAMPLVELGVFARAERLTCAAAEAHVRERATRSRPASAAVPPLRYGLTASAYAERFRAIREAILAGDIYQANFTFPVRFPWTADAWSLYARLAPHQRVEFAAVIDLPGLAVASLSPELFLRKRGRSIESRPMKGTMRRGATEEEDRALAEALRHDAKNLAENRMIVDLIRNDLGRLAEIGSVRVDDLFRIESYATLHQMVSTVRAEIAPDTPLIDILRAVFPCGSVTGAPKIRAMEIIAELEDEPRGIYTGAIGYVTPGRELCLSVPIRTVELEAGGSARMGIGSGVVADSSVEEEYAECLLKAEFLVRALA